MNDEGLVWWKKGWNAFARWWNKPDCDMSVPDCVGFISLIVLGVIILFGFVAIPILIILYRMAHGFNSFISSISFDPMVFIVAILCGLWGWFGCYLVPKMIIRRHKELLMDFQAKIESENIAEKLRWEEELLRRKVAGDE